MYCTVTDVKALANATLNTDDALLTALITRATQMIDTYTGRTFNAHTTTRHYTPGVDTDGDDLHLKDELLTVTTLTNGDGAVIGAADYALVPLDATPKRRVRLRPNSGIVWTYLTNPIGAISVAGTWGYTAMPPADIVQATARLALWLYRQREAPFGRTGNAITGEYEVPAAFPADIASLLVPYRRAVTPFRRIPWGGP